MPGWLDVAWGKFRGAQRACHESERLTKPQMRAAWKVWDLMRKTEEAAFSGEEGWADKLHAQTVELASSMDPDLRTGPRTLALWLVENRDRLAQSMLRTVGESAHTRDSVSAKLTR
ncbi:hypothetical protein LCGC14_0273650 [marine sediment metagenome]|uniref:Uncharacterized protein n=2 Tax=root TaxID=1 RepID=A0A9C9TIN0_9HYPH|nr:hypothetical protein [Aurantimonas coralicida]